MRQEVYRVAYDEASSELNDILAKFEHLRLRKDQIEKVVEALKPLVVANEVRNLAPAPIPERSVAPVTEPAMPHAGPIAAQAPPSGVSYSAPQPADEAADPFSRRVENVMGMSASARDVREYSRLFNSGTPRGN